MRKWVCYGMSCFLGIFYIWVLLAGIKPEVPLEYKMYYIDHTLMNWPGYGGLCYEPGEKLSFRMIPKDPDRVRRRGQGWGELTSEGCGWAQAKADLYFSELKKKEYLLELDLVGLTGSLSIMANQTELSPLVLGGMQTARKATS